MTVRLVNGQVWENERGLRAITQWIDADAWVLLRVPFRGLHTGNHMIVLTDEAGRGIYPAEALKEQLTRFHWRLLPKVTVAEVKLP